MKLLYLILSCVAFAAAVPMTEFTQFEERDLDCSSASYKEKMLTGFNTHRANHSAPDMVWNETLAAAAKVTTNKTTLAHDNAGTGWGQNLYDCYWSDENGPCLTPGSAIDWWYNGEFSNYDAYGNASILDLEDHPNQESPNATTPGAIYGHFTQSIWVDSVTVGCHTANKTTSDGYFGIWTACNFYPPGNWVTGDYSWYNNVLEPLGDPVVRTIC